MFAWKRASVVGFLLLASSQHESEAWTPSSFVSRMPLSVASKAASSTVLSMAQPPLVDEWKVDRRGRLVGSVRNHPDIDDGDIITTSLLADPALVSTQKVVSTISGSKYKLGNPKNPPKVAKATAVKKTPAPVKKKAVAFKETAVKKTPAPVKKKAVASKETLVQKREPVKAVPPPKQEYYLNGESVGDGKYLLSGKAQRSTSGKSTIYVGYRTDKKGMPTGDSLTIKVSPNFAALERECNNYQKVTNGFTRGMFVKFIDYLPVAGSSNSFSSQSAVVLETGGDQDVKEFMTKRNAGLEGKELRDAAATAAMCIQACHASSLVWTDLKAENLVVKEKGGKLVFKGIDLESACPMKGNPVDYSPEACPPEFANAFLKGDGANFVLSDRYDVWSFGMLLYELNLGRSYWGNKNPALITKMVKTEGFEINVDNVPNEKLRDLIRQCCRINPKKRPSITQVLLHPYFLTTGIGPFAF